MSDVRPGQLVVATPALLDPNFADSVVLLLDADAEGALGVVLNRPSPVAVSDVLAGWADQVTDPEVLFHGGPVGTDGALAVGLLRAGVEPPVGFRPVAPGARGGAVVDRLGLVDLDTPLELVDGSLAGLRIFAGYAGWGAAQLEAEIAEGSWYVVPGCADDVFRLDTATLWREVLRRQPGELAWSSTRPADPDLN